MAPIISIHKRTSSIISSRVATALFPGPSGEQRNGVWSWQRHLSTGTRPIDRPLAGLQGGVPSLVVQVLPFALLPSFLLPVCYSHILYPVLLVHSSLWAWDLPKMTVNQVHLLLSCELP